MINLSKVLRGHGGKFISTKIVNGLTQRGTIVFSPTLNKAESMKDSAERGYVVIDKGDYAALYK